MCSATAVIAGVAGVATGAMASSSGDDDRKKKKEEETVEKSKELKDNPRRDPLVPDVERAQVRIGDSRSLRKLATERSPFIKRR